MPNEVSGLSAWFDASIASPSASGIRFSPSDNADVAKWKGLSGNGYDAVSFTYLFETKFDIDGFNGWRLSDDTLKLQNSQSTLMAGQNSQFLPCTKQLMMISE